MAATTTQAIWNRDMENLSAQLAPFTFDIDGDTYLRPEAPANLTSVYRKLVTVGYAKGWA